MQSPDSMIAWLPWIGTVLAIVCLFFALRANRHQRLIDGLPTCKTTGVFIGLVEVKGTAEVGTPLTSYLASAQCVYFSWIVEEEWSRTVTESYTDSDGKTKTRTKRESGWATVAENTQMTPFYLKDDCGLLLIRPDGAKKEPKVVFEESCGRSNPLYYGKGPSGSVPDSDHRRRFREVAVPLHAPVYIMGQAREREDIVAPEIADDKDAPMFLISTRREEQISSGHASTYWLLLLLGLILCSVGFGFGFPTVWPNAGEEWIPFALGAAVFMPLVLIGWVWTVHNCLIDLRNRVASAWSQVDVQLKRRFDLIPRIEAVVKGLQQHEQQVQVTLATLRTQQQATPPGVAGADFQAVGRNLIVLAEKYPALTANGLFLALQKELSETEQRIALARGYFNDIATHYNTRLEVVPDRFVAALARLQQRTLMAANDFERAPVQINLAQ